MPNPEARAAYNEAQEHSAAMREIHAREMSLMAMLDALPSGQDGTQLSAELIGLRDQWMERMREYQEATARFIAAIGKSRQGG